jgi:hypothetical protein
VSLVTEKALIEEAKKLGAVYFVVICFTRNPFGNVLIQKLHPFKQSGTTRDFPVNMLL